MKNLLYYILNLTFPKFNKELDKILKSKKKIIIFDVGCYKGVFIKNIQKIIGKNKFKFYLFDINKNVKIYISNLLKSKHIYFHEIAMSDKNGTAIYNYNRSFESSGSSLSTVYKNDNKWNSSRNFILKILMLNNNDMGFIRQHVKTITLDTFLNKKKIKLIDILKVDVDGSEFKFLHGAKNSLKKNKVKALLIEITERKIFFNKKEKRIINFLKKINFILIRKSNIFSVSIFSEIKSNDYFFVNKKYLV